MWRKLAASLAITVVVAARSEGGVRAGEEYERHAEGLRGRLPAGFAVVVERPFVVVGDGGEEAVRRYARGTVRWAVERLKRDFFEKDPEEILEIYLFRDEGSYKRYAWELFRDEPTTPFGYYSPRHRALVMNIATGGGTLVHEIVHPFMRANFAACPAWLNEGLGSLYEQSADRGGHIVGLTNWRLAGLQRAIRKRAMPSLDTIVRTSDEEFYGEDAGAHYAAARYLCYYLQERGLLTRFYREFVAGQKEDPTGLKTLRTVLGEDDLAAFQSRWEEYVLSLRFP